MINLELNEKTKHKHLQPLVASLAEVKHWKMKFDNYSGYHGITRNWYYLVISRNTVERVAFLVDSSNYQLKMVLWPANTVDQARNFYRSVPKDAFFRFEELGWSIDTHLTFAHIQKCEYWANTNLCPKNYFDLIQNEANSLIGQKDTENNVDKLKFYLNDWSQKKIISTLDVKELEKIFASKSKISIRPGFQISKSWCFDKVNMLNKKGKLECRLLDKLDLLLKILE